MRFNDLFNHYDTKRRGELGIHELKHLVREIMPKVTDAQIWLFQVGEGGKGRGYLAPPECIRAGLN